MRKASLLLAIAAVLLAAPAAAKGPIPKAQAAARAEMRANKIEAAAVGAEVGDVDSFGRNVRFIGSMQSGTVTLTSDCTPSPEFPPGPDDECIVTSPAPGATSFNATDVGR